MVVHSSICDVCGREFSYDAPANPVVEPDYCGDSCARAGELTDQLDDGGLSRAEAEVFVCREVLGLDRHQTANRLDKSKSTIDSQYQRAKRKARNLTAALEEIGYEPN